MERVRKASVLTVNRVHLPISFASGFCLYLLAEQWIRGERTEGQGRAGLGSRDRRTFPKSPSGRSRKREMRWLQLEKVVSLSKHVFILCFFAFVFLTCFFCLTVYLCTWVYAPSVMLKTKDKWVQTVWDKSIHPVFTEALEGPSPISGVWNPCRNKT